MTIDEAVRTLESGFSAGPPGPDAQLHMAPRPRPGWEPGVLPEDARIGAALLLVYPRDDRAHVLLTKRPSSMAFHAGQVSLPGGGVEAGESLEDAALREAHEEVGLAAGFARTVGRLSPLHIPVSGFNLHAVVAVAKARPVWIPSEREVERILEIPIDDLVDPERQVHDVFERPAGTFDVPYFAIEGERVWGATAMILAEFLSLLGHPPEPWHRRQSVPTG